MLKKITNLLIKNKKSQKLVYILIAIFIMNLFTEIPVRADYFCLPKPDHIGSEYTHRCFNDNYNFYSSSYYKF